MPYISYSLIFTVLFWTGCQNGTEEDTSGTEQETEQTQQQEEQQQQPQEQMQQQIEPATDISDAELQKFVDALMEVQGVQQGGQAKMMKAISDEGMEVQRFNEIMQQKQSNPNDTTLSAEEEEQFNKVNEKLRGVQMGMEEDSKQAIKDAGLSVERYQAIMMAVRQDTSLQREVQQMLQGS